MDKLKALLDKAEELLQGEPARAIGYGAAVVIYLVARAVGAIEDVSLDQSLVLAAGYVATVASVIESIRHFVYSPATVAAIVDEQDTP